MTTQDVANRLVDLCRQGEFNTALDELYAKDAVSIEMEGQSMFPLRVEGLKNLIVMVVHN